MPLGRATNASVLGVRFNTSCGHMACGKTLDSLRKSLGVKGCILWVRHERWWRWTEKMEGEGWRVDVARMDCPACALALFGLRPTTFAAQASLGQSCFVGPSPLAGVVRRRPGLREPRCCRVDLRVVRMRTGRRKLANHSLAPGGRKLSAGSSWVRCPPSFNAWEVGGEHAPGIRKRELVSECDCSSTMFYVQRWRLS